MVAQYVLPTEKHLELRLGHDFLDRPQPLPGVLLDVPDAGIEGGAAPHLHGIEAALVEQLAERE